MSNCTPSFCPFSLQKPSKVHQHFNPSRPILSSRQRCIGIRCCVGRARKEARTKDYYQLLGVSVDSTPQEIKEAYRKLQKKYHPDIAGEMGHEYTLMLNEAYHVLIRDELRRKYDVSTGRGNQALRSGRHSSWNGPLRPQALFVDENACIGCRECVHHSGNTFVMDDALGCARVKVQFGDEDKKIEVSVDSCPVNCIHWVDREELPLLEFLMKPQPKQAYGVFGGGWERPTDVFKAAKYFSKQLKSQQQQQHHYQGYPHCPAYMLDSMDVEYSWACQVTMYPLAGCKCGIQLTRLDTLIKNWFLGPCNSLKGNFVSIKYGLINPRNVQFDLKGLDAICPSQCELCWKKFCSTTG